MNPRTNYEMTQADLEKILDACKPVPYIVVGGSVPSSPQENANRAWAELSARMGFDAMTVRPIEGKSSRFFTAVPSETTEQKAEREAREVAQKRREEIELLQSEIAERETRLEKLLTTQAD